MTSPARITSAQNDRIKAVVRLVREQRERRATGCFVAEGSRLITRAIHAGLQLLELYDCPTLPPGPDAIPFDAAGDFASYQITPALMGKIAYRENPERYLAVFAQPAWARNRELMFPRSLVDAPPELWLVAVGLAKPGNLGAMARTVAAAGATGMIVADGIVDPFNPNALHASTGAVLSLPILHGDTPQVIRFLVERHVRLFATLVGATTPYTAVDLAQPVALVIGPEDTGLDDRWQQAAAAHGQAIAIPMPGASVDSLNAANAAAIVLFEALRQRAARR